MVPVLCDMGTSQSNRGSGHDPGCNKGSPWGGVEPGWDKSVQLVEPRGGYWSEPGWDKAQMIRWDLV